jgi:hypothetical protein
MNLSLSFEPLAAWLAAAHAVMALMVVPLFCLPRHRLNAWLRFAAVTSLCLILANRVQVPALLERPWG